MEILFMKGVVVYKIHEQGYDELDFTQKTCIVKSEQGKAKIYLSFVGMHFSLSFDFVFFEQELYKGVSKK